MKNTPVMLDRKVYGAQILKKFRILTRSYYSRAYFAQFVHKKSAGTKKIIIWIIRLFKTPETVA